MPNQHTTEYSRENLYHEFFKRFPNAEEINMDKCQQLVDELNLTIKWNTVQRAVQRVRSERGHNALYTSTIQPDDNNPSVQEQVKIVGCAKKRFQDWLARSRKQNRWMKLAFLADVHIPYQDMYALELAAKILQDYQPDIYTGANDEMDFEEYSRWPDLRSPAAQLWTSDIQNAFNAQKKYRDYINSAHKGLWVELNGNHDKRRFHYLREKRDGTTEYTVLQMMRHIESLGSLQFNNTGDENWIKLSPGLKLRHGISASKNPGTVAKNTLEAGSGKTYQGDAGVFYNVVYGHDHRMCAFDYYGVQAIGAGCLCQTSPKYMGEDNPNWQQGLTLVTYDPNGRSMQAQNIKFSPTRRGLVAIFGEKEYRVKK